MIKAIIFDCFGVLIADALDAMLVPLRESTPEVSDQIAAIITAANKGTIRSEQSRSAVAQLLGLTQAAYMNKIRTGEVKNAALLKYIRGLRLHYKVGMLSNTSSKGLEVRFTPVELAMHFDAVVASGVVGYAKPEARAYEIVAERLDVRPEECIMIDDREAYCNGARNTGMQAILYGSLAQLKKDLAALGVSV